MKTKRFLLMACGLLAWTLACTAQTYRLSTSTVDGGGGNCAGAKFSLSGAVGQADAGLCAGNTYVQQGGFVPGLIKTAGPLLTMTRSGAEFRFTWPNLCTDFALEASSSVNGPVWTSLGNGTVVGANRRVTVFSPTSPAFFRLRKDCPAGCSSNCPQ